MKLDVENGSEGTQRKKIKLKNSLSWIHLCVAAINFLKLGFDMKNRHLTRYALIVNNRLFLVFSPAVEKLELVECDLEKRGQIGPALGNASVVICCIGASEKEVFDITGPYRIDYLATKNLIDAGE